MKHHALWAYNDEFLRPANQSNAQDYFALYAFVTSAIQEPPF